MFEHHRHRVIRLEWRLTGEHFPSHNAHGVQIALGGGLVVFNHFRSQIRRGAQQHARCGQGRLGCCLCQTEIGDLHVAAVIEQNVFRLDVPVDDTRPMRSSQSVQGLRHDAQGLAHGERTLLVHLIAQIDAMDVFHDQIVAAVNLPGVVDLDDVRVRNGRRGPSFTMESFHELFAMRPLRQLCMHHFDSDMPVKTHINRLIHGRHAAVGDFAHDTVPVVDDLPFVRSFSHVRRPFTQW